MLALRNIFAFLLVLLFSSNLIAQELFKNTNPITKQDIQRGAITPERQWWDLLHYRLAITVDPEQRTISGTNTVRYKVVDNSNKMQIDLQPPMNITRVTEGDSDLDYFRDGNAYFITLPKPLEIGSENRIVIHFSGTPKVAIKPPWDGGISWNTDSTGAHFIASSNQGIGSSVWWPNKDHPYDEPDMGIDMLVTVPDNLIDVSNGRLVEVIDNTTQGTKTFHWRVINPINNYGVNINIGRYAHFAEKYKGEVGALDMDYWVIADNLEVAKNHFKQAVKTIEAFEHWMGPYPFYEDGFKLVEVPYLGMEHQSSVTYGNGYKNGYLGADRSKTGHGLKFDYILIHEVGHEWFANNITAKDVADMWIHESFTTYAESLFVEYHFGKKAAFEYLRGKRIKVFNTAPIMGVHNAHREGSADMYDKGAAMLHNIRLIINDDNKWRSILRGLNKEFFHQTVSGDDIKNYISNQANFDFTSIFNQYLNDIRIPTFEYHLNKGELIYRWNQIVENFEMPIRVKVNDEWQWLTPTAQWQKIENVTSAPEIDKNFYVFKHSIFE